MNIPYYHESIRLTGRWDTSGKDAAITTATGSYIEFAFEGNMALIHFKAEDNATPKLHLWIQLDGGDMIEAPIDNHIRIVTKNTGYHVCKVIYKGGTEADRRWYAPLTGKVSFVGVQTESPAPLAPDMRKTIEFVGDSITEGVLIDTDFAYEGEALPENDQHRRCHYDDVCATYAYLTAQALDLRPVFMGYGAVGITHQGMGAVPPVEQAYPYNFDGSPKTVPPCDYILINHGANDRSAGAEAYISGYVKFLDLVRESNPDSEIIVLSPFIGAYYAELEDMVSDYNRRNGCRVHFIDSHTWIPDQPLHPYRDGHRKVAQNLVPLIRKIIEANEN